MSFTYTTHYKDGEKWYSWKVPPETVKQFVEHQAQMVHQGYHTEHLGTWRECPKNVCASARVFLEENQLEGNSDNV